MTMSFCDFAPAPGRLILRNALPAASVIVLTNGSRFGSLPSLVIGT